MSIRYVQGNLIESTAAALVNTVNEVGVMGKGIALQFREAFPANAQEYAKAAKAGEVRVGRVLVTPNLSLLGPRWIIHFPTKKHWRQPSKLEWVRSGLVDLARVIALEGIESIALPPLGCGNGGLEWGHVRGEIEGALAGLEGVEVTVYEPTERYYNAPKREGVESLTPARAVAAELIRRYSVLGFECSLIEVQKLAWFATRVAEHGQRPDPLKLEFSAHYFGPYDDRLRHLLEALDGSYLHCEKRLADAKPLDVIWFEDSKREVVDAYLHSSEGSEYLPTVDAASEIIDGFESPFGMELLATVDWLLHRECVAPDVASIREGLARWPGASAAERKQRIFDDRVLNLALDRLRATFTYPSLTSACGHEARS